MFQQLQYWYSWTFDKIPFHWNPSRSMTQVKCDPISTSLLTNFMVDATTISTHVVGIIKWSCWITFIPTNCLRISTITTFDTRDEVEVIRIWQFPILWLPIGILCGAEWGCEYTYGTPFLNWMDGLICSLYGPNWPPNSMPFNMFCTIGIPNSCSCGWSINALATFCSSTCRTMPILMWKGTKGQSTIACLSSSQNA